MKNRMITILSLALSATLVMSSCALSPDVFKVPELIEPAGVVQTYRPCSRHDLGGQKIYMANVVPKDYYHFFKTGIKLDEICVNVGDYVNVGDELAKADVKDAKNQRDLLYTQLSGKTAQYNLDVKNHELTMKQLENAKSLDEYAKNFHPEMGVDDKKLEEDSAAIEMEKENKDYLDLVYQYDCRKIREDIAEWDEIIETGTLKAYKEGYVTYVKSLEEDDFAKTGEAIVTVSDYDDPYLLVDIEGEIYNSSKYEVKFALDGDKRVPLEEYSFSESEKALMQIIPERLKAKDTSYKFKVGDRVPVMTYRFDKMNVLAVGSDSADYDENGEYVFILKDDGTTEKRYFEYGYTTGFYMEVVSGIEEGEKVLYSQSQIVPDVYDKYTVSREDSSTYQGGTGITLAEKSVRTYFAPDSGTVEEIYVNSSQTVKEGDPLVKIKIDPEKGNLASVQTSIKQENDSYNSDIQNLDKQYKELHDDCNEIKESLKQLRANLESVKQAIASLAAQGADTSELESEKWFLEDSINMSEMSVTSMENGIEQIDLMKEYRIMRHNSTINMLNLQYSQMHEQNDGSGYKTIYAKEDGIVKTVLAVEGNKINVETGDNAKLLTTSEYYDDVYILGTSAQLREGAEYTLKGTGDSKGIDYEFECLSNAVSELPVAYTHYGKPYLVFTSGKSCKRALVRLKNGNSQAIDAPGYTFDFASATYKKQVVIENGCLYKEVDYKGVEQYFVWKIVGEMPVKEYITIGTPFKVGDELLPVILEGVEEGDVLAKAVEKKDEEAKKE